MTAWAPQYSRVERVRLLLLHGSWALPLVLFLQFAFFPWFEGFVQIAHCQHYRLFDGDQVTGLQLVIYGLFVGLPVMLALTVLALEGRRSYRSLRLGQFPLPGEKVWRPTRYLYGGKARLRAGLFFLLVALLLAFCMQGYVWAGQFMQRASPDLTVCLQPWGESGDRR
ncbi:MAG: hypothetical protein R3292_00765 [Alcanivorax sp.]|nr:hypothetical protein [Alcanivorax sp.]